MEAGRGRSRPTRPHPASVLVAPKPRHDPVLPPEALTASAPAREHRRRAGCPGPVRVAIADRPPLCRPDSACSPLGRGFITGTAKPAGRYDATDMRNVDPRCHPGLTDPPPAARRADRRRAVRPLIREAARRRGDGLVLQSSRRVHRTCPDPVAADMKTSARTTPDRYSAFVIVVPAAPSVQRQRRAERRALTSEPPATIPQRRCPDGRSGARGVRAVGRLPSVLT
ncbi:hypothetical protein GA0115259_1009824 [Streptomyces sp. MnatMP-M17]|nr:hypothetical protein GA0115259_1009824 [Streptomyces sp. MnatMP-M17]